MSEAALVSHAREADPRTEIVPTRVTDERVQRIIGKMVRREWRPEMAGDLASEWGCSVSAVQRYSAEAGRFLRLISDPNALRAKILARLTEIGDQDEGDRVPALLGVAKVSGLLEAPDPRTEAGKVTAQMTELARTEATIALLRDPPEQMQRALCAEWLPRSLAKPDVIAVLEAAGWQRP